MPGQHPFTDLISGQQCELVIFPGFPGRRTILAVKHPGCDEPADVSAELDAFYCPSCHRNGRVSGAWCRDMVRADREESAP